MVNKHPCRVCIAVKLPEADQFYSWEEYRIHLVEKHKLTKNEAEQFIKGNLDAINTTSETDALEN